MRCIRQTEAAVFKISNSDRAFEFPRQPKGHSCKAFGSQKLPDRLVGRRPPCVQLSHDRKSPSPIRSLLIHYLQTQPYLKAQALKSRRRVLKC